MSLAGLACEMESEQTLSTVHFETLSKEFNACSKFAPVAALQSTLQNWLELGQIEALSADLLTRWLSTGGDTDLHVKRSLHNLAVLGFTDCVSLALKKTLSQSIVVFIRDKVESTRDSYFDFGSLSQLRAEFIVSHLSRLSALLKSIQELCDVALEIQQHFQELFDKAFIEQLSPVLFDLIVDMPDTLPIFEDLHSILLLYPSYRSVIADSLIKSFKTRLLRPAASTMSIIQQYISTVQAISIVDPPGHLVQLVTEDIRSYLQKRPDTVKSIIMKLFDAESADQALLEALKKPSLIVSRPKLSNEDEDYDPDDWDDETWTPLPSDIGQALKYSKKNSDILSSLVNIFESTNVFVDAFQSYLSSKILQQVMPFDYDQDLAHLELLKIRFGDVLHNCEVMLKDVADSKRLDYTIHKSSSFALNEPNIVHSLIVSHLYWPKLSKTTVFTPPPNIQKHLDEFLCRFKFLKQSRTLKWQMDYGCVEIEIDLPSGQHMDLKVTPFQAAIIFCFEEKKSWSGLGLSTALKCSLDLVKSKISFWVGMGVLYLDNETYYLSSSACSDANDVLLMDIDETETENSNMLDDIYWTYIKGMLTNLGALPVERIHMMLSMFIKGSNKFEMPVQQFKQALMSKVAEGELEFLGEKFSLKKN